VHSVGVGIALVAAGDWGTTLGGWGPVVPRFFVRQFGVFHFVIAAAYLIEYLRYRGVAILITAKMMAVVSLAVTLAIDGGPWAVGAAAAGDALMAAVVWQLARRRPTPAR
jgi:hypothetical protein